MKFKSPEFLAIALFSLNQLQNIVREVLIKFFGIHDFLATFYWNRVYAIIVLLILIMIFNIPRKIPKRILLLIIFLPLITVYGLLRNSIYNVFTDLLLITTPFIFLKLFSIYINGSEKNCIAFVSRYYKLNIIILLPAIILKFFEIRFLLVDYNFLICYTMVFIVFRIFEENRNRIKLYVNLILTLFYGIGKVILVQSILLFFIRFLNRRRLLYFIPLLMILYYSAQLIGKYSEELTYHGVVFGSLPRGVDLIKGTNFAELSFILVSEASTFIKDPLLIFTLTDPSTAHRLFELFTSISKVNGSIYNMLFGTGLGGTIDFTILSGDFYSDIYDDTSKVRVVHLMPSFFILKFGYIITLIFFFFVLKHLFKILFLIKDYKGENIFLVLGSIGLFFYIIGATFTFSLFLKDPMLAFYLYCYIKTKDKLITT